MSPLWVAVAVIGGIALGAVGCALWMFLGIVRSCKKG